ncbi:hypothetical protein K469DRAFT_280877 [Zopfia rhizophila CBS 207.26]|uniref:Uncharacterized protein n=1 Tax=Zopfia rhizophila CBS 207.26 TaxID=1314779 RepID=A0A6A6ENU2_9PEZI|nr:hypothetical protein K469DRAFT_280877 [Zopfia rhizophila CBS 207.26]
MVANWKSGKSMLALSAQSQCVDSGLPSHSAPSRSLRPRKVQDEAGALDLGRCHPAKQPRGARQGNEQCALTRDRFLSAVNVHKQARSPVWYDHDAVSLGLFLAQSLRTLFDRAAPQCDCMTMTAPRTIENTPTSHRQSASIVRFSRCLSCPSFSCAVPRKYPAP